jgi:hypothetical protein
LRNTCRWSRGVALIGFWRALRTLKALSAEQASPGAAPAARRRTLAHTC